MQENQTEDCNDEPSGHPPNQDPDWVSLEFRRTLDNLKNTIILERCHFNGQLNDMKKNTETKLKELQMQHSQDMAVLLAKKQELEEKATEWREKCHEHFPQEEAEGESAPKDPAVKETTDGQESPTELEGKEARASAELEDTMRALMVGLIS